MSLLNVDQKELYPAFVFCVESVERGNLPAEWRSGITAEDQDYGTRAAKRGQLHFRFPVLCFQRKVGSLIANLQDSCSSAQPHLPEGNNRKDNSGSLSHNAAEDSGWLTHCDIETGDYERVESRQEKQESD